MKNDMLEGIKQHTVKTFTSLYGWCGLIDGDNVAMINRGGDGENFVITIKDQSAIDRESEAK